MMLIELKFRFDAQFIDSVVVFIELLGYLLEAQFIDFVMVHFVVTVELLDFPKFYCFGCFIQLEE